MTVYAHLTGKERAQQETYGVDLPEHPARPDFIEDYGQLIEPSDALDRAGIPPTEDASDDVKEEHEDNMTVLLDLTGTTTDLTNGATRVLTATLKRAGSTEDFNDTTVVTFSKASGSGTVSGLGNATVTDGVATKTVTATGNGAITIQASAPGFNSDTLTFTIVAP